MRYSKIFWSAETKMISLLSGAGWFVVLMVLAGGAAAADLGRQVSPGVWETKCVIPEDLTKILPTGSDDLFVHDNLGAITAKPTSVTHAQDWVTLLADDFETGFPGTIWTLFYDGNGPYWDDWSCWSGSSPSHSVGAAAGGEGAISCGENYPNYQNTFMTAGPISLADPDITAGVLECSLNLNCETEIDFFYMLVSLNGKDDWTGYRLSGVFHSKIVTLDLTDVPYLGNILGEPEVWMSFGFRSNGTIADVNGAQIDDVVLAVEIPEVNPETPSLQITVLKNPGRPRTLQILVKVSKGSGSAPVVTIQNSDVAMTDLGQDVYSGIYSAAQTATKVVISASDTNSQGTGTAQATVSFQ